jgi:arginase
VAVQETLAPVAIIGAGLDLGAGRRGVDMGPSAIRYAGLAERLRRIGRDVVDRGDVGVAVPEAVDQSDDRARYLKQILETCSHIADLVEEVRREGSMPLVLGGDHSIAMGTLGGLARAAGRPGGVLWIDAHGDLNTPESSPSGNQWGMPLRMLIDSGAVGPGDVVLIGARNLDPPEEEFIAESGVRLGEAGIEQALEGASCTYVALDVDVLEPSEMSVFMPEPEGLSSAEVERILRDVAARTKVLGAGFTGLTCESSNIEPLTRFAAALGL